MSKFKVLMYHEIIKKDDFDINNKYNICVKDGYNDILPPALFTYLEDFEEQMRYISENNIHTLTLQEVYDFYYNEKAIPKNSILLTFDDMFYSVFKYAYPILKKYNLQAVGFVVVDWIFEGKSLYNKDKSVCMNMDNLNEMKDVFTYANHTKSMHKRENGITSIMTCNKEEFINDVMLCEKVTTFKEAFAYPFGKYTNENIEWLKEINFKLAFTSEEGINNRNNNPLLLKRDVVYLNIKIEDFKKLVTN